MSPSSPLQILDVTIRDGSNLINHQFYPEHISEIIGALGRAGVGFAEVGHGLGIGGRMIGQSGRVDDEELLEAAREAAPDINLSIFIQSAEYSLPLIPGLADFFELGRVAYSQTHPGLTEKIIQKIKKYDKKAACQLVQAHLLKLDEIGQLSERAEAMGADLIYLVDSFGSFLPGDVREYMQAIRAHCGLPIGFHAHNNLGLATSNSLLAWREGATWLDASVLGVGRGAGNAVLESLVAALEQKGHPTGISLEKLCDGAQEKTLGVFNSPPTAHLIDLLTAKYKIIFEPEAFLDLVSASLHIHLDELFKLLHNHMEKPGTLHRDQLFDILKKAGLSVDHLIESLKD